jgi:Protein of unknown function (DUF3159)
VTKRSPYALPEREPGAPYHPSDMLRDKRAIVDTGLAPIVFIVVNTFAGLHVAAAAAIAVAVLLMVERLVRRASPINAIGGLLGTGIAVYIALRTGTAEGFFWPKVAQNTAYGVAFLISVLVRRPLVGLIIGALYQWPAGYTRDPRVRPAFTVATLAWVVLFGVRAVVYTVLILAGKAEWLGAVVLVLGWPAFAATIYFGYRYVTYWTAKHDAPDPDEFRTEKEAQLVTPPPAPQTQA